MPTGLSLNLPKENVKRWISSDNQNSQLRGSKFNKCELFTNRVKILRINNLLNKIKLTLR